MTVPAQDEVSLRAVVVDPAAEFRASVEWPDRGGKSPKRSSHLDSASNGAVVPFVSEDPPTVSEYSQGRGSMVRCLGTEVVSGSKGARVYVRHSERCARMPCSLPNS